MFVSISLLLLFILAQGSTFLYFLLMVLLVLASCASGAEVAFFSLTYQEINQLKTRTQQSYRRIISLLESPKLLQASLMVAGVLAKTGIIIISNELIGRFYAAENAWMLLAGKGLLIFSAILLFCEILPRTLAAQNNIRFARDVSLPVEGIYLLFNGIGSAFLGFSEGLEKKLGRKTASSSMEELNKVIDLSTETNASPQEKSIMKSLLKFGHIQVKQAMRARLDVQGIPDDLDFVSLRKKLAELRHSRLPVYRQSLDDIRGMIHTKDLLPHLHEGAGFKWQKFIRPVFFVHQQKLIKDLMSEFQQRRSPFAVVVDEFGGTSGIITMEDILEEVIGDIKDEFDREENINRKIDDLNYVFEGKTMLNDVCRIMQLPPDKFDDIRGAGDSLAGLVLELAGHIPAVNDQVPSDDFVFTVLEIDKNRIKKIRVTIR